MFRSLRFTKSDVTPSILLGFFKKLRGQSFKSVFFQPANFGDRNSTIEEVISTCLMIRPLYFTKSDGTHSILLGILKNYGVNLLEVFFVSLKNLRIEISGLTE